MFNIYYSNEILTTNNICFINTNKIKTEFSNNNINERDSSPKRIVTASRVSGSRYGAFR